MTDRVYETLSNLSEGRMLLFLVERIVLVHLIIPMMVQQDQVKPSVNFVSGRRLQSGASC